MKMYVGITDYDWFQTLKKAKCDEVNFWKSGGQTNFKVLDEGEMFLFKLHSPRNYIVGESTMLTMATNYLSCLNVGTSCLIRVIWSGIMKMFMWGKGEVPGGN